MTGFNLLGVLISFAIYFLHKGVSLYFQYFYLKSTPFFFLTLYPMKIMLFFLPFLLFFQACKKESQPNGSPEMGSLLLIDSLRLPLDPSCSASSAGMVYFEENGKEWLYFFNEKKSDIRVFDLQTERQTDIIPIHRSGPDYIPPGFLGFHPWSSDSILVPAFNNTLYLIDREGKVLQKIDYGQL